MKRAVIWDLDGTLFDSYGVIVESIALTFRETGLAMDKEQIRQYAIGSSIKALFAAMEKAHGVSAQMLQDTYSRISAGKWPLIISMPNARQVLERLERAGIENYVFTHRGKTTMPVLRNLNMESNFREVVTSQNGFARKPDPEGLLYLMRKHSLNEAHTWYVGDRSLDMDCARNAGIPGILYLPPGAIDVSGGAECYIVKDLLELLDIVI